MLNRHKGIQGLHDVPQSHIMHTGLIYCILHAERGATPDKLLSAPHDTWAQTPQTLARTFTASLRHMICR
jgi:hypothetical protein